MLAIFCTNSHIFTIALILFQARGYRTVEQFSEDETVSVFLSDLTIQFETVLVLLII